MSDLPYLPELLQALPLQAKLAFSLCQDPALLRDLFAKAKLSHAPRIALALEGELEGSAVLIDQEGQFASCLATGQLSEEETTLPWEDIESLLVRDRETLRRSRTLLNNNGLSTLLEQLFLTGNALCREDFQRVADWQPLLEKYFFEQQAELLAQLTRLRGASLSPTNERRNYPAELRAYFSMAYATGHFAVFAAMRGLSALSVETIEEKSDAIVDLSWRVFQQGVSSISLRFLWATARIGEPLLAAYRRSLRQAVSPLQLCHSLLGLCILGLRYPARNQEIQSYLKSQQQDLALLRSLQPTIEQLHGPYLLKALQILRSPMVALQEHRKIGQEMGLRLSRRFSVTSGLRYQSPDEVSDDLAFALPLNAVSDFLNQFTESIELFSMLPFLSYADAAALYLPRSFVMLIDEQWSPRDSLSLLERVETYEAQGKEQEEEELVEGGEIKN